MSEELWEKLNAQADKFEGLNRYVQQLICEDFRASGHCEGVECKDCPFSRMNMATFKRELRRRFGSKESSDSHTSGLLRKDAVVGLRVRVRDIAPGTPGPEGGIDFIVAQSLVGNIGTISSAPDDVGDVRVDFSDEVHYLHYSWLDIVDEKTLRVGARIRVRDTYYAQTLYDAVGRDAVGREGEVIRFDKDDPELSWLVRLDNGDEQWMHTEDLEAL